jgi:preprotein translocase subunit SecE
VNKLFAYLNEAWAELGRVSWPTRAQATRWTIAVIVFSIALALFVGILDFAFSYVLQHIILKG